jgi:O-antigen ligase
VRYLAATSACVLLGAVVLTLAGAVWVALPVLVAGGLIAVAHRREWRIGAASFAVAAAVPIVTLAPFLASTPPGASGSAATTTTTTMTTTTTTTTTGEAQPLAPHTVGGRGPLESVLEVPATLIRRVNESLGSGGTSDRLKIQRYQLKLWVHHPIFGVGLGAADLYLARAYSPKSLPSTYGIWWGVLSETGLVGTLALLAVLALFGREVVGAARAAPTSVWYPVAVGCLIGVIAEFVSYLTFYERIAPHVWAMMGIGLLAARRARAEET